MWRSRTETVEGSIMHKFAATDLPFRSLKPGSQYDACASVASRASG